jgi:hypothetical protein
MNSLKFSGKSDLKAGRSHLKLGGLDTITLPAAGTPDWVIIDFWGVRPIDKRPSLRPGVERTRMMVRKAIGPVRLTLTPEDARAFKAWFEALEL